MADWRDIKNRARTDAHMTLRIRAFYRAGSTAPWKQISIRLHHKVAIGGELDTYQVQGVTSHEIAPKMVFLLSETGVPPRGAIVSISETEAWRVGDSFPPDGITVAANVAAMKASEIDNFPVPERDSSV